MAIFAGIESLWTSIKTSPDRRGLPDRLQAWRGIFNSRSGFNVIYDGNGAISGTPPVDANRYNVGDLVTIYEGDLDLFLEEGWFQAG